MSNSKQWVACWLSAAMLALGSWYAFEHYWYAKGHSATVMDSYDLWAQHRENVVARSNETNVALLGASRIQYGLSPRVFEAQAAGLGVATRAPMLAINGHYPLAALRDLAHDPKFKGIAVVGIDSRGFQQIHREMQAKWPHYYRHEFTPAKSVHRSILTKLQPYAISLRPDFAWSTLAARYVNGYGDPNREYVTFYSDRSGGTDYSKSPIQAVREARIRDLKDYYANTPAISPTQWLADADEVIAWVRAINARGGRVVFYREPVSGGHLEMDEARFPRTTFWDALAKKMPATMIDFRDDPSLQFDTPDTSHIDAKDIDAHTRAFVRVLHAQGVLK
jgi:hypothetical protein